MKKIQKLQKVKIGTTLMVRIELSCLQVEKVKTTLKKEAMKIIKEMMKRMIR
jgi:hypothetical protein